MGEVLEPILASLIERNHSSQLLTNNRLRDERLSEHNPLVGPLHTLIDHRASIPNHSATHDPTLMVEVAENNLQSLILLSQQVLDRDLNIIKGDESSTRGGGVGSLNLLGLDTLAARDEEDGQALLCTDCGREPVGKRAVRDPLFSSIDDVELPTRRLLRGRADSRNITSCKSLRNSQRNILLARENLLHNPLLELLILTKVEHGRQPNDRTATETIIAGPSMGNRHLLEKDKLVEVVELLRINIGKELAPEKVLAGSETHGRNPDFAEFAEEVAGGVFPGFFNAQGFGTEIFVDEFAGGLLEAAVGIIVIGVLKLRNEPAGLGILLPPSSSYQSAQSPSPQIRKMENTYRNDISPTRLPL